MEGDRGAGELGTGEGGKRELSEGAESGSRNQKGTRLLFITAYHPVLLLINVHRGVK